MQETTPRASRRRVSATVVGTLLVLVGEFALLQGVYHQASPAHAALIHATLLIVVSIGWFAWFRRLVRRHRTLQDAASRQSATEASEQRLLALVQNGSDFVAVLDEVGTVSYASPSARRVLGADADVLFGHRLDRLVHPDDRPRLATAVALSRPGAEQMLELRLLGGERVVEGVLADLRGDAAVGGLVLTLRDVTERHALRDRLTRQAYRDPRTGLGNRQLFSERLEALLTAGRDDVEGGVVLLCDLDDFRDVNDSLGHDAGDRVLSLVAGRIHSITRDDDTLARLGGDEFALLRTPASIGDSLELAAALGTALAEPLWVDGVRVHVSAGIGIAPIEPGVSTATDVLRRADVAMYRAKDSGPGAVATYDADEHTRASQSFKRKNKSRNL